MATISRFAAVARVGRFGFSGFIAWLIWLVIHLLYLIGFKQRVTTLLHWTISFVGRGRAERAITRQQIVARRALDTLTPAQSGRPDRARFPRRECRERGGVNHELGMLSLQRDGELSQLTFWVHTVDRSRFSGHMD